MAATRFAREHDVLVSVRGGGHNVAGKATADGALMIDLSAMRSVHVDPALSTVRVGGGCLWSDVDQETQAFGLATTGGTVSHTGVAGLTLGGGLGWLAPLHGFTCDNLVSVDLVTATGDYLRVSDREHAELLWALRGGGGNFGVATSFELRLHPVGPMVYGGPIMWPAAQSREILAAYVELGRELPDELSLFAGLIPNPEDMQPLVAIVAGWFGPLDGAERPSLPCAPVAGRRHGRADPVCRAALDARRRRATRLPRYWKSGHFTDFPEPVLAKIADAGDRKPTPLSVELFFHQHGAATRVAVADTAFPHRAPSWDFDALAQWFEPEQAEAGSRGPGASGTRSPRTATASTSTISTPTTRAGSGRPTDRTSSGGPASSRSATRTTSSGSTTTSSRSERRLQRFWVGLGKGEIWAE